jgi:hypothetical protein
LPSPPTEVAEALPKTEKSPPPIDTALWLRIAGTLENPVNRKKMNRLASNGEVEVHLSSEMRPWFKWTANFVGTYGGGSIDGAKNIAILDLIAQMSASPMLNVWAGRMLVPSDRSNFSGPYFMAAWNYPGAFGMGPRQGPFGRNDGVTVWGQFGEGLFKYYAGAYNLYGNTRADGTYSTPLFSGRLNLSLLNPEPGFYHSSTYYGKDILAIGLGGQYQRDGTSSVTDSADYSLVNADILFEKALAKSGVIDVEGAIYKYSGSLETNQFSYFALVSYLTPNLGALGKLQPLLRIQQTKPKDIGGVSPDTNTAIDAQVGYVIDGYALRCALGIQHAKGSDGTVFNQAFLGIQAMR